MVRRLQNTLCGRTVHFTDGDPRRGTMHNRFVISATIDRRCEVLLFAKHRPTSLLTSQQLTLNNESGKKGTIHLFLS